VSRGHRSFIADVPAHRIEAPHEIHILTPSDEPESMAVARSLTGPTGGKLRVVTSVRDIAPAVFDILA